MTQSQGIFDDLVAAAKRIDLGSNAPGQSPSIVAGFGVPTAAEATGSIYYRQDAPNAALMLYVRASGAWWPIASTAFADISVANEAALTAFDASGLPDGAEAYVASHRSYWTLRTQALTLRANELIASNDLARQWIREPTAHLDWALQYAPNVFVDAGAGNNENDGLTNLTALLNMEEVARRVPYLVQPIAVNYVGATNPATAPSWTPLVRWLSAVSASTPTVTINGVETVAALPANATGVVNTATNGTAATNTPPRFTDTGGAGVAWPVGTILRVTDGPSAGAWTSVVKDEGGGVARTSIWRTAAGTANSAAPLNGNHYQVVTQTTFPDFNVRAAAVVVNVNKCRFTRWTVMETGLDAATGFYSLIFCFMASTITFMAPGAGASVAFQSCFYAVAGTIISDGVSYPIFGSGVVAGAQLRVTTAGRLGTADSVFQGHGLAACLAGDSQVGGQWSVNNCAFFDCAEPALIAQRQGQGFVRGALWGAGNAVQGTQVRSGGRVSVKTGITPTLASTGQELEVENAATAIPALAAGAVVPAAQALASWADWNGANFTRNVVNYTTGAAVIDSA